MTEKILGYIFNESAINEHELRSVKQIGNNVIRMVAVLQEANLPNRNKRIYPKEVINEGINTPYIKEKLSTNSLLSELNHPTTNDMQRQMTIDMKNIACVIKEMYWDPKDPNLLLGNVETAGTSIGKDLAGLVLENNMQASFSMRGMGNVVNENGVAKVKGPLRVITYDTVHFPSHQKAYQRSIVNEFTTMHEAAIPVKASQLAKFVGESSKSAQVLNEQVLQIAKDALNFELDTDNNLILKENTVVRAKVLLEKDLHKEVSNSIRRMFF